MVIVKERGFMPFSAAGALIVVIALVMVAQTSFSKHQRSLGTIDDVSGSSLLMIAGGIHGDIQSAARYAVYRSLWEVSKEASNYDDDARKLAIESLATRYFAERVSELGPEYSLHDARIEMEASDEADWPSLKISDDGNGYVSALASLPDGSRIKLNSWDGRTSLAVPFENVGAFVDSRYFLLEELMDNFVDKRGDIIGSWWTSEYSIALTGALLSGNVVLDQSRSKTFFEAAWGIHELNNFGSSDYWANAQGLINFDGDGQIMGDSIGKLETNPLELQLTRENFYELMPPAPIKSSPGISVYRELNIKRVSYRREDPAGLLSSPTATPIPFWSTGVTLWWGQWEITVELKDIPIEEIFDFDNPTIPILHGSCYVHKPLAYRWEMSEKIFKTTVTIISLKPFTITKRE